MIMPRIFVQTVGPCEHIPILLHDHMILLSPNRLRLKELYQERSNRLRKLEILVVQGTLEVVEVPGLKRYLLVVFHQLLVRMAFVSILNLLAT